MGGWADKVVDKTYVYDERGFAPT